MIQLSQRCMISMLCTSIYIGIALLTGISYGAEGIPTDITASHMEYSAEKQEVVFTGNVYVKRPDFELWSKKLIVYFKAKPNTPSQANATQSNTIADMSTGGMDKIVATGNVIMKSDGKEGHSDKATYYSDTELFIMEGKPILKDGNNRITGRKVIHNMRTNQSQVQDGVKAHFLTPDNDGNKPATPVNPKKR